MRHLIGTCLKIFVAALLALTLGACASYEIAWFRRSFSFQAIPPPKPIEHAVFIETGVTSNSYRMGSMKHIVEAWRQVMTEDLAVLFTRPIFEKGSDVDFILRASLTEGGVFTITAKVTVTLIEPETGATIASFTRTAQDGSWDPYDKLLYKLMPGLKQDLMRAFNGPSLMAKGLLLKLQAGEPPLLKTQAPEAKMAPSSRRPATLTVSQDGSGDYKTLEDALAAAVSGDTILLRPGRYGDIYIHRSGIRLVGESREKVIVGQIIIGPGTQNVSVQKLTVTAGKEYAGIVVKEAQGITIEDCAVVDSHDGIFVQGSKDVQIRSCLSEGNIRSGILADKSTGAVIKGMLVKRNGGGIVLVETEGRVEHNTIVEQKWGGLIADPASMVAIYNNLLAYNGGGISAGPKSEVEYNNTFKHRMFDYSVENLAKTNLNENPFFMNPTSDFRLRPESPLINKGSGGTYIGAFPPVGLTPGEGEFK